MNTRRERLSKEKYGIVITLVVMLVSVLLSKSHLNDYFDVTLCAGIFSVIGGFLYSLMHIDNIKMGQTIIIGGIATMILSCAL